MLSELTPDLADVVSPQDAVGADREPRSALARLHLGVFEHHRAGLMGLVVVVLVILFSFVGPLIYHTDQIHTSLSMTLLPPSAAHPLGTDDVGYDVLGRLMVGGQTSLEVGIAAAVLATGFGVVWGAVAGFVGGLMDSFMMRMVDALLAIPALFLLIVLGTIITPSVPMLIFVVAGIAWLVPSRLIRAETLSLRTCGFVEAARGMGGSSIRMIARHIIPNAIGTIVVNLTFQVADAILTVAALSFLGLGVPPPAANWGSMLSTGTNYIYAGDWWLIYPSGVAIVITVVAFNLMGDALREALDVRLLRL
jgi:peptide/nickel transport system permease protein